MANNEVWFVTGGSKGLGLALVRALLSSGYRVAATSRSLADVTAAAGAASPRFLPLGMDPADAGSVERAVAAVREHFGGMDVVVNNAGYGQLGAVEEVSDAEARRNFDANVFGTLNVLRAALPTLRARGSGHVFNIASIGGYVGGFSGFGVYCATKFAVAGLTEALHEDLRPLGIKVTLVYPGYFRTSFLKEGSRTLPAAPLAVYAGARESERQHSEQIDGNQPGDPDKAARALLATFESAAPPLHLFLGADAVSMAEAKLETMRRAIDEQRALSVSTAFAP
ncbi:MAG: SDR family NAD(P)-dependent oxidoreductase [Myxococcales bacterium]|nr:MAG: SDR family NAD(P)-dependent oxidoreductase [Myxococcales bacterium]